MNNKLACVPLATAGVFLGYLNQLEAGDLVPMAYAPPAPTSDCDACNEPGWYGGVSLLYLQSYGDGAYPARRGDGAEGGDNEDGDWDLGVRGTLGFEKPNGQFFEMNGFWYEGDYDFNWEDDNSASLSGEVSAWYIEGLIGDNLHCGEACLDYSFGIRFANIEKDQSVTDPQDTSRYRRTREWSFEGIGPVVRIDGIMPLNDRVSLYAGVSQAILFGDQDFEGRRQDSPTSSPNTRIREDSDEVAFVTELEGGLQFDFNMGRLENAHVRLGIEAQYWTVDENDTGLFGGVLGVGFNF